MRKTNFDRYLEEQLKQPVFAECFKRAGEAWDEALQVAALREKAELSPREFARRVKSRKNRVSSF